MESKWEKVFRAFGIDKVEINDKVRKMFESEAKELPLCEKFPEDEDKISELWKKLEQ